MPTLEPRDPVAMYAGVLDALPILAFIAEPGGRIVYVSRGWKRFPDSSIDAVLDEGYHVVIHPGDLPRVVETWDAARAAGTAYADEFRILATEGAYRWVLSQANPMRGDGGEIASWFGTLTDIDDRVRADGAREHFANVIESSVDFIGIADLDGRASFVNEAGRRMLEIASLEEARATPLLDYFVVEDRNTVVDEVLPAVRRDGRWSGELRLRNFRTDEAIPIDYNVFTLEDGGTPVGFATVSRDLRDRNRVEAGLRALAETGAAMYGSLDFQTTLRNVADAVARSFASVCTVDVVDADRKIRSIAASHDDASIESIVERAAAARNLATDHPVSRAIFYGESALVRFTPSWMDDMGIRAAIGDDVDRLDLQTAIYVPIRSVTSGSTFGALTCARRTNDPRGDYVRGDVRFAEEIAARAGTAFENARAYERQQRIAVALQEASLPKTLPTVDDLELSAEYRPGNSEATIGGDWYDAFYLDDGRVAITIGDVMGNGLGAAVTMGKVRQSMRSAAMLRPDPNAMLDVADRTVRDESEETYATASAGIFDPRDHRFSFASAGHPGPAVRRADGRFEEYAAPGLLLGLRERGAKALTTIEMTPGTTLVFFTDGLIEATRDTDEGQVRLVAAMADLRVRHSANPAHALVEHVLGGRPATDDIAVLVARLSGDAPLR
ncbi:MAG: SpoIIE family protein phosphatase [Vulcanimicrobiaceae bacterium]